MDKEQKFNLLLFVKKNWNWIILAGIIIFGFHLRIYHIDYPVIGYHNMKEVHYLTEARNFARDGFFTHGFFTPRQDYPYIDSQHKSGAHSDTFPFVSTIVAFLFRLFGFNLVLARLVGILFMTFSILLIYLIIKKIFENEKFALITAFLFATNPLFVFFSRNVQLINIALFFMLLSLLLFVCWWEKRKKILLILTSLSFTISVLTKYPFAIILIPMLGVVPWKELSTFSKVKHHLKKNFMPYVVSFLIILIIPFWALYNKFIIEKRYGAASAKLSLIELDYILKSSFFQASISFIKDNYTLVGFSFFLIAAFISLLFFIKKRNKQNIFLFSCLIAIIPFVLIMARKITKHSYHHYPIAPFIIIFIAYFILLVSNSIGNIFRKSGIKEFSKIILFLILLFLLFLPSKDAWSRQFDTQFYGLDAAGDYIKEHKKAGETLVHSGHQAFGVLWHGDIKGMRGGLNSLEDIKKAEQELNASWLFIYQWDLNILQEEERGNYIKENYELRQAAFIQKQGKQMPLYLLFKKNDSINESLNEQLKQGTEHTKYYELTGGNIPIIIIEV